MLVPLGDTYYFKFTTRDFDTGAPQTLGGTPALSVYEENNLTQITAGITLTASYDSVTGLNDVAIVATSGNGYEVGKYYDVVITTGTVDTVSVVGEVVGHFRVGPAEDAGAGIPDVNVTHVGDTVQTAGDLAALITTVDTVVDAIDTLTKAAGTGDLAAMKLAVDNIETDTADMQPKLGTPVTSISADIATVDTEVGQIKTKTDYLPSATAGAAGGVFIAGTNAATTVTTSFTTTFTGNLTGSVASVTGAVGSVTGAVGSVTGNVGGNVTGSVGSLGTTAKQDVNDQVADVVNTDTLAEVSGVPAANASLSAKVNWLFVLSRNKGTQTATTKTIRNDADSGDIATSTHTDDGTTFTRGEWV